VPGLNLKQSSRRHDPSPSPFSSFFWIGLIVVAVHYGVLVFLVEIVHVAVLPATLTGYVAGGVVSYLLKPASHVQDRPSA